MLDPIFVNIIWPLRILTAPVENKRKPVVLLVPDVVLTWLTYVEVEIYPVVSGVPAVPILIKILSEPLNDTSLNIIVIFLAQLGMLVKSTVVPLVVA